MDRENTQRLKRRMASLSQVERIAQLEVKVDHLTDELSDANHSLKNVSGKLDELLVLRNKGAGVFWLAATLFGTSVIGITTWVINMFRGG